MCQKTIVGHDHLIVVDRLRRLMNASKDAPTHHQGTLLPDILPKTIITGQLRGSAPVLPYAALLIFPGLLHQCHHILHAIFIQTECQPDLELALLFTTIRVKPHMKVHRLIERDHHHVEPVPHLQRDHRRMTIVSIHPRLLVDESRHL